MKEVTEGKLRAEFGMLDAKLFALGLVERQAFALKHMLQGST